MALDLGTIITAVEAVQKAIELCNKVVDLPEKMKALGRRMERQNILLLQVEKFVKKYATGVNPILEAGQRTDLMRIIGNIKENADKVYELFERVDKGILSAEHNLEFRSKTAARIWYALIERPNERIEAIMEDMNHDRKELSDYVNIISAEINAKGLVILKANAIKEAEQREKEKEKKALEAKVKAKEKEKDKGKEKSPGLSQSKPTTATTTITNTPNKPHGLQFITVSPPKTTPRPRPSPSPSPIPLRQDYKILFVDPRNQARSVVAQSLLLLLGALTTTLQPKSPKSAWRISQVHSAGFFVSHKSTLTPSVTSTLPYSHKSYKMGPFPGNEPPNPVALSAVFDNKSYPYAFKSDIYKRISNRKSVGLTEKAFKEYDYIIVFTNREHDNMVRLKDALIKMGRLSVREKGGKGRVLHLGTYIPQRNGAPKEILALTARKDGNGKSLGEERGDWNRKVGEIKTALKGFLREEMDWVMPEQVLEGNAGKTAGMAGKDSLGVPK